MKSYASIFAAIIAVHAPNLVKAQVNLTTIGSAYTQDFDGLATSGTSNIWTDNVSLTGWYSSEIDYIGDAGTSTTGGLHSYGTTIEGENGLISIWSLSPRFPRRNPFAHRKRSFCTRRF